MLETIKRADLQIIANAPGEETGLRQLGGRYFDDLCRGLVNAIDHKMAAEGIARRIPELIFGHAVAIGIADRKQAGEGK